MKNNYSPNEKAYAKQFYDKLNDLGYMTPRLAGRYPSSVNGNRVVFNGLGIKAVFLFKEKSPKELNLTLEMSLERDPKLEVIVETSQCLDDKSKPGILSEKCIDLIFKGFFIPGLKDFHRLYTVA
jgi:hypothetical protein